MHVCDLSNHDDYEETWNDLTDKIAKLDEQLAESVKETHTLPFSPNFVKIDAENEDELDLKQYEPNKIYKTGKIKRREEN